MVYVSVFSEYFIFFVNTICRLSVRRLSVTFCIVAKWYVLVKNCLKERIGNQGQRVHFLGRHHISTSGFASTATETATPLHSTYRVGH